MSLNRICIRPLLVGNLFQLHRPASSLAPTRNIVIIKSESQRISYNIHKLQQFWNTCVDFVNTAFVLTVLPKLQTYLMIES